MKTDMIENFPDLNILKQFLNKESKARAFIAGGCFKSILSKDKAKDIDIFFESAKDFEIYRKEFEADFKEYEKIYENNNAVGYRHSKYFTRVDLVRSVYGTPEQIISRFDFTVAKFALYIEDVPIVKESKEEFMPDIITGYTREHKVIYHNDFFEHLMMKKIVVDDKITFPASTFNRMIRYIRYGFIPCRMTKIKIIKSLKNVNDSVELGHELYESFD